LTAVDALTYDDASTAIDLLGECEMREQTVEIIQFVIANAIHVAPWFFLSIGLGVVVRALRLADGLGAALNRRPVQAILAAVAIGAFSPFCSCTVIPVVAGLLTAGVPLAPVMAFWVASPTMDPEIFTFTVSMLGWELAIARLIATLVLSAAAGFGVHLLVRRGRLTHPLRRQPAPSCGAPEGSCDVVATPSGDTAVLTRERTVLAGARRRLTTLDGREVGTEIARQSWSLGRWLLAAFALEALILAYVPQETIASALGGSNLWSVPMAAAVGVPLYVSNFTALPIVSGLLSQGMGSGAAIAFLLAGPVTTMPAMLAVRPLVRREVFWYYLAVALVGAMALGAVAGALL
jgi:uncharacterized protein